MTDRQRPVILCILDGWGYRAEREDNAVLLAHTPTWDRLFAHSPGTFIEASGGDVGLPNGQMGNSEVGHINIGAGRIVMQELPRIDRAAADGSLAANEQLQALVAALRASGGTAHLMGLLSTGGVHAHQDHMAAAALAIARAGVPVAIHAFLDGRDTPPKSALGFLARFEAALAGAPSIRIATVIGRFYAMDRDNRWERVAAAYEAIVAAAAPRFPDARSVIDAAYAADLTDEFVKPAVIAGYAGMQPGDGILMTNFRSDRAREILSALVDPAFDGFARTVVPPLAAAAGLVEYSARLSTLLTTLFPPTAPTDTFGEIVARAGMTQLRMAETEKYPHVTFFFNGGRETEFPGEQRILVPSPKVATYDLQPEMSAYELTDRLVEAIDGGSFDAIVVNFANPDMVGHSGDLGAAIKACEAVDRCLARVEEAVRRAGGAMIVTADHGNAEMMRDPVTGQPHTAHTTNKVPLLLVNAPSFGRLREGGRLADIAPTLLQLLGLPQPAAMTGRSLIAPAVDDGAARQGAATETPQAAE